MNDNRNFYDNIIFETSEDRAEKRRKMMHTFSRFFIGLFAYLLSFQLIGSAVYIVAKYTMSAEQYASFSTNAILSILLSSGVQYLLAFPLFLLITKNMPVSEKTEKKKLTIGEIAVFTAIAEAFMYAGNLVGTLLNSFIGSFIGKNPTNGVEEIVSSTPMWLLFLFLVVIGPIVEEIIFRKVMIDRISIYGDHVAIIFSAAAFGLMHGNLYQLFYATLLGALLGYVYTKTRDVRYTIVIHMILNLLGSVIALPVQKALSDFSDQLTAFYSGLEVNTLNLVTNGIISTLYTSVQTGLIIAGVISLIYLYKRHDIHISKEKEIFLPDSEIAKGGALNVGAILFVILTLALTILNLF